MNESTLIALKTIVEHTVRPVQASIACKRKMREELLAHVFAVFETEAKLGDELTALEQTRQRFGDAEELTRQLQASAPMADRVSGCIERLIGFPPRGSKLRLASRHAGLVVAMMTPLVALTILIVRRGDEWLTLERLPALLMPLYMAVLVFCASLLTQSMAQALTGPGRRHWTRGAGLGIAAWLLVPALNLVWCFAISGDFAASLRDAMLLLLTGWLAPLVMVIVVIACNAEIRYCEEWASLPMDGGAHQHA